MEIDFSSQAGENEEVSGKKFFDRRERGHEKIVKKAERHEKRDWNDEHESKKRVDKRKVNKNRKRK
jgi:hypothetical protein